MNFFGFFTATWPPFSLRSPPPLAFAFESAAAAAFGFLRAPIE